MEESGERHPNIQTTLVQDRSRWSSKHSNTMQYTFMPFQKRYELFISLLDYLGSLENDSPAYMKLYKFCQSLIWDTYPDATMIPKSEQNCDIIGLSKETQKYGSWGPLLCFWWRSLGDLGGKGKIPMMILLMAEIRPSPVDMVDWYFDPILPRNKSPHHRLVVFILRYP